MELRRPSFMPSICRVCLTGTKPMRSENGPMTPPWCSVDNGMHRPRFHDTARDCRLSIAHYRSPPGWRLSVSLTACHAQGRQTRHPPRIRSGIPRSVRDAPGRRSPHDPCFHKAKRCRATRIPRGLASSIEANDSLARSSLRGRGGSGPRRWGLSRGRGRRIRRA